MEHHSAVLLRRLNPYCARALEEAASLCQTRAHAEITPEHWLLKLLEQGEGDLTVLARRYEWDMDAVWQSLLSWLDVQPRSVRTRPELSASLQTLLKQAWLTATLVGDEQIRSIYLLTAMIETSGLTRCDGLWPLMTLTTSQLERLRPLLEAQSDERHDVALSEQAGNASIIGRAAPLQHEAQKHAEGGIAQPAVSQVESILNRFTVDVTARAREGKIDPVFGRDNEIRQMVDILSRRRKNNPILVGEPGVGKTALVEGLALRIAEGNVPESLKPVIVRTLDLGLLQAGAGVKGEFEQRLKNIIDAVQQSPVPVLLFIDEAHTIIGAGNQAGGADAANLLKPALARGELRTIAATTWSEYKQYFERDAALERRFQMVKVDEPDDDTACLMLRGLKSRYAEHHGVHITGEAVRAAVTLSRRYLTGRQLPDKAVDLLDTAAARVRMSLDTQPEQLTRLQARLTALAMEQQELLEDISLGNAVDASRLPQIEHLTLDLNQQKTALQSQYETEKQLTDSLKACREDISRQKEISAFQQELAQVQNNSPLLGLDVDVRTVATVIADWISDTAHCYTDLDGTGVAAPTRNFARELRQSAWRKWLGSAAGECADVLDKPALKKGWEKIQMLAKKNAETYEIVFDFIPKNYIDSNPYPAEITPSVSDTESTKTNEIPASIWPVMNTGDKIKSFVRSSMPFSEIFWRNYKFQNDGSLHAIKGYFTALPIYWTEGENNMIRYNMRLIASNAVSADDTQLLADNSAGDNNEVNQA